MQTLRERIPFKLISDDNDEPAGGEDDRVLDEQEQEEVIADLRNAQRQSAAHHYRFLQGCVGVMVFLHIWFLLLPPALGPTTPAHILLPAAKTPRAPLIPLATPFALLNLFLLLNLAAHLPHDRDLSLPRVVRRIAVLPRHLPPSLRTALNRLPLSLYTVLNRHLPPSLRTALNRHLPPSLHTPHISLPLPLAWITSLLALPALTSLLLVRDAHQVVWWTAPLVTAGVFVVVRAWIVEGEREVEGVEGLRYEAKGA